MVSRVNVLRVCLLSLPLALVACKKKESSAQPSASASAAVASSARPTSTAEDLVMNKVRRPTGPRYAILTDRGGVGPIFPGATVATIERHMKAKCPELTKQSCRFVDRGIEFLLDEKGVLTRFRIHRLGRAAGGGKTWGPFNGAIPPDLLFGMLPSAIKEHLGKPEKVVKGNQGAHPEAVEQHRYGKAILEYDRMPNGQLVLGGVRMPE